MFGLDTLLVIGAVLLFLIVDYYVKGCEKV
jgi:hypothetical protein